GAAPKTPVFPALAGADKLLAAPPRLLAQGDWLFAADGTGGLCAFDLANPDKPRLCGAMPSVQARSLALSWPWLYLADGPGGLVVVDVADPAAPRALASLAPTGPPAGPHAACGG